MAIRFKRLPRLRIPDKLLVACLLTHRDQRLCRYMLCVACLRSPAVFVDEAANLIPALHPRRP